MNKLFHPEEIKVALVEEDILSHVVRALYFHVFKYGVSTKDWVISGRDLPSDRLSHYVAKFVCKLRVK